MTPSQRESAILVVSHAPVNLEPVSRVLEEDGFTVEVVSDGPGALAAFRPQHRLVIVDDTIPGGTRASPGSDPPPVELCRALRARSEVPIIILTVSADEDVVVAALDAGADDVVTIPVRARELVARARAAVRRGPEPVAEETTIEIGEVRLDPSGYVLTLDGERVEMTRKEFELLRLLMTNAGQTVPRRMLIERVWGWESTEGKTLDTHIRRIRAKIEADPSRPARIVTVRKVGYRYNRPKR
ncbi:MAG: two-component system, OmpR family, response regulator RegX3 [Actinomycetota bacterium]|nr:two-component system, OmpR family, response regulator RegX3 [Actinomycetota bacterium]